MKSILFCTSNEHKLREAKHALGVELKQAKVELDELQEMDLRKIVEHKAWQAYRSVRRPIIVEDAGLYLDYWSGFPGPFIKWAQNSLGYKKMAASLPKNNNGATMVVLYGYCDGKKVSIVEGKVRGKLLRRPRGQSSFGFDPWFMPNGNKRTYAEMTLAEKDQTSARGRALVALKKFFNKNAIF